MDTLFEVYETDADDTMDPRRLIHSGRNKDLAETRMVLLFNASGWQKDYLVYDAVQKEPISFCMSAVTAMKRGMCQG